jgi:hypothetical protein
MGNVRNPTSRKKNAEDEGQPCDEWCFHGEHFSSAVRAEQGEVSEADESFEEGRIASRVAR